MGPRYLRITRMRRINTLRSWLIDIRTIGILFGYWVATARLFMRVRVKHMTTGRFGVLWLRLLRRLMRVMFLLLITLHRLQPQPFSQMRIGLICTPCKVAMATAQRKHGRLLERD